MKPTKIAIIGAGNVGATIAFACIMRNLASEIIVVDCDSTHCHGQVLDLSDALSFSSIAKVTQGTYAQAAQADIIIITAGKEQKAGQSRRDTLDANTQIILSIANELKPLNPQAIIIMVSNPVDALTYYAQQIFALSKNQIMGSGTLLDTIRLRGLIGNRLNIAPESIDLYVVGEHGDNQVALFSSAQIAGRPISQFISMPELIQLAEAAKNRGYEIINHKGFTAYGVASCVVNLCQNILFDQKQVIPISCFIKEYNVCMSMPAVIGIAGIETITIPQMDPTEQKELKKAVELLIDEQNKQN